MKRKVTLFTLAILILFTGVWRYYSNHFTSAAILKNATNRDGYLLNMSNEPIEVELFIKPEWIPFDSEKPKNLNVRLCKKNNTQIILTQVWNRGNDIYFTFDTVYDLDYDTGEFLYNGIFHEDGSFTANTNVSDLVIYNLERESISLGQKGFGPNSAFGFGLEPEEYDKIKNGFYIKYSGMILYSYSLE